ncbi:DNA polymerase IIIc chi subunit [Bradyrhizobium sp. USDA 4341]
MTDTSQTPPHPRKSEPPQDTSSYPCQVTFYEFASDPDAMSIGDLAEAHLKLGRRVLILAGSEARCRHLSKRLWTYRADSFLPHGLPDQNARLHPVLLDWTLGRNLNQADTMIVLCGLLPVRPEIRYVDYLFDGNTPDEASNGNSREGLDVRQARQRWYECVERLNITPRYFSLRGRTPGSVEGSWSRSS